MTLFSRCVLALAALVPASLLASALPAAAASTIVLQYTGSPASNTTATDMSGFGNDGTLHDVTATGSLYSFGSNAYISVPASDSINPDTSDYSYAVTMELPAGFVFTHDLSLVRRGAAKIGGAYYKMELVFNQTTGAVHLVCAMRDQNGNRGYVSTSASSIGDGTWHTLMCTKTATSVTLTKDGVAHTKAASLGNLSSTQTLNIGAEQVNATTFWEHFPGQMENITITKG
jgi:concanavalin A-like lectin/glucanase superfamily protein